MTDQRSCAFYISWFSRLYRSGEHGWFQYRTPDDQPIGNQDAYFMRCLEVICSTRNMMMMEDMPT